MAAPFEPAIIRSSSLNHYADCPRRSATRLFRRDLKESGFRLRELGNGIGAAIGTALHGGAAMALRERAQSGVLPPESLLADAAQQSLKQAIADGITWDRATPELTTAQRQLARQARSYWHDVAPYIHPIQVEERLEAQFSPGIIVTGHPDTVAREPGAVHDLKAGRNRQNCKPQLGSYSLLARSNNLDITRLVEDCVPRTALSKPQPKAASFVHDVAAAETAATRIISQIESDLHTFREGDPERRILAGDPWAFPANPNSMLCGDKYCAAHGTEFCREWMQKEA